MQLALCPPGNPKEVMLWLKRTGSIPNISLACPQQLVCWDRDLLANFKAVIKLFISKYTVASAGSQVRKEAY